MPSILCNRRFLFNSIGRPFSREQFEDICFQFGIELDGVLRASDVPSTAGTATGKSDMRQPPLDMNNFPGDDDEVYKIDCPANRYDLLSTEGLALALRSFLGIEKSPQFSLFPLKPTVSLYVKDSVKSVRDFIACAVLRNVSFTNDSFHSFIDYQEKLHLSLGRKRSLVSVGTHDLDKITTPLSYEAVTKEAIQFIPLKQTTTLDCSDDGLIQYYKDDKHINKYVSLISHFSSYPVVFDKNRSVLSLPPIINSQFSHMSQKTRNIFIECTGVDKAKTHIMLNLMVYAVATHCVNQFVIEPVEIQYENGTSELTPQIESRTITCDIERMKRQIGIPEEVSKQECCELLKKMQLISEIRNNEINVTVPFNRPDILHECDIMEDLAIAYGYNNLGNTGIQKSSVASQNPMEKLSHLLRLELACAGYCETLTLSLCSHDEAFKSLNRRDVGNVVKIANPQTQEFQVLRPSLLPGTLKTLASNQNYALPIQLFEISDVVCLDATQQTGAKNKRRLSALYCNTDCSGFEAIHGLLDYIMTKLDIPDTKYYILETENPTYLQGRSVQVFLRKNSPKPIYIGELGVLHPDVLLHYQILNPCAYIELNLEELL